MKIKFLVYNLIFISIFSCVDNSVPVYLNKNYSYNIRVKDLISRMTTEDKVAQMCQYVSLNQLSNSSDSLKTIDNGDSKAFYKGLFRSDIEKLVTDGKIGSFLHVFSYEEANYLQKLALKSRLKIPLMFGVDAIHGNGMVKGCTVYPSPIAISSTFSDSLSFEVGKQTSKEIRATGSHWAFAPNIDVARDFRWGRVGETFGEDPKLVSNIGVNMIKGLQYDNQIIACAKHFIAGSEPINGLNFSPMDISERKLREVYLPPFKNAVNAGVKSVMIAHNEINGIPCHMNKYLITNILKDEFNFSGLIVSDWMDVERLYSLHHVAKDFKEACLLSINAGLDINMHGPNFYEEVLALIKEDKISINRIDNSVKKILLAKFKLGLFENRFIDTSKISNIIFSQKHRKTSLEVARKSIVLLKNNNNILPLKSSPNMKILVTGPNANNHTILGDWTKPQPTKNVTTIYEGIKAIGKSKGFEVDFYNSNSNISAISEKDISRTSDFSKNYDFVILVVGDNSLRYSKNTKTAGENNGRANLSLMGKQLKLIKSVNNTAKNMIVIYVNSKPIAEPWIHQNVDAIIEAWEPGSLGGKAVAEVIFGDVNPSGKLPITFPRSVGQLQMHYNFKPSQYYRKYIDEEVDPLYCFGHGLSYSTFEYSNLKLDLKEDNNPYITVSFLLKNKSNFDGEEVVQLYLRDSYSSVTRPVKELINYKRVFLKANESKIVKFKIKFEELAFYDLNMSYVLERGDFIFMVGGSSNSIDQISDTINLNMAYSF